MTNVKRVMSIGAHSLDAELLGGPLLIRYAKAGAHVSCIHVTQGRCNRRGKEGLSSGTPGNEQAGGGRSWR